MTGRTSAPPAGLATPAVDYPITPADDSGESSRKGKGPGQEQGSSTKRRCVSSACIACRRRKSKCDGNLPSCAACSSVYHTPCIYDPNSDHRRKGVYRKDVDNLRIRNATLQTLIHGILHYSEDEVFELVHQIRSCNNLDDVAEAITARERGLTVAKVQDQPQPQEESDEADQFGSELSGKMSELMLDGSVKFVGGTSNLIFLPHESEEPDDNEPTSSQGNKEVFSVAQWTRVTDDEELVRHLITMYFTWHYAYFTVLNKSLFYRDFIRGHSSQYCSSLLVNAMLALGCHFSSWKGARENPDDSATAGDHFFKEAKRLMLENDEHEKAKLCTVQALAIMSVREAGCGREGKGWVYSGMSFRMAYDLGLNVDATSVGGSKLTDEEIDARRITFWGCFLFDKCWSNYLGRLPQLTLANVAVPKFEVFPSEESEVWAPYTDSGIVQKHAQPARTRAIALQISKLCEISNDLLAFFYHPSPAEQPLSRQAELKRLSDVHTRLEAWKSGLPAELEPKDGRLPPVLLMHMFYHLLFIHLYRPFLKYTKSTSPLPPHVSPRRLCTQAAAAISRLFRMYKRSYGLRQICNLAVYIAHTACTIHLLNLPDQNAKRDLIHGLRSLEEMAEGWLCARRTLRILDMSANKWRVNLPEEAVEIFERTHAKWGSWAAWDRGSSSPSATTADGSVKSESPRSSPNTNTPPSIRPRQAITTIEVQSTPRMQQQPPLYSNEMQMYTTAPENGSIPAYQQQTTTSPPEPSYLGIPISYQDSDSFLQQQQQPAQSQPPPPPQPQQPSQPGLWNMGNSVQPSSGGNNPGGLPAVSGLPTSSMEQVTLEGSQDWWFRDQNSLALGLDNWDSGLPSSQYLGPASSPTTTAATTTTTSAYEPGHSNPPPPPPSQQPMPQLGLDVLTTDDLQQQQQQHQPHTPPTQQQQQQQQLGTGYGYAPLGRY